MSEGRKIASCLDLAEGCLRDARLLLNVSSRNAAYLASQAAEHLVTAVATSEGVHIERKDAHQLETIIRKIPSANPDRPALATISFLEAYAISYRYGTPTGRIPQGPGADQLAEALGQIETLMERLRTYFEAPAGADVATNVAPRR